MGGAAEGFVVMIEGVGGRGGEGGVDRSEGKVEDRDGRGKGREKAGFGC